MRLAPHIQPQPSEIVQISNGKPGIFQTLHQMRRFVNAYKTNTQIRNTALTATFLTQEKFTESECEAVFSWVQKNIRYVGDVYGVETLSTPTVTLQTMQGDCDDQSCLLACLFESIGHPTRFVVADYSGGGFEHVYLQVLCNGQWVDCDPTEHNEFGWCPPGAVDIAIEKV